MKAARSKKAKGKNKDPLIWFGDMEQHCLDYADTAKKLGRKIVGIMCEYTPREIIMASGAIPVCLCATSARPGAGTRESLPNELCPLIKSSLGVSVNVTHPMLALVDLIVAEASGEGKKKLYDTLGKRYPLYVLELPQKPDDTESFQQWVMELRKLKTILEQRFRTTITRQRLRWAIREMNRERALRRKLLGLMKSPAPPMTGLELMQMRSMISCMPGDWEHYEDAISQLPGRKIKPPADKRVRILLTGGPVPRGADKVVEVLEQNGGLVVCQENCTGLKPLLDDVDAVADDPIQVLAEKYVHIPCVITSPDTERMESLRSHAKVFSAQCVVELVWPACQAYAVSGQHIREYVEGTLKLPYLKIETDPTSADSARIAARVKAFLDSVPKRR